MNHSQIAQTRIDLMINKELSTSSDCQEDEKSFIAVGKLSSRFPFLRFGKNIQLPTAKLWMI